MKQILLAFAAVGLFVGANAAIVYDNTTTSTGYWYGPGTTLVADDTTLSSAAHPIVSATVWWYEKTENTSDQMFVGLFDSDSGGNIHNFLGGVTYNFGDLPVGSWLCTFTFATPIAVTNTHIWTAIQFNDTTSMLWLYDPPTVGSSGNYFAHYDPNTSAWGYSWFGGTPAANFKLQLNAAVPEPTSMAVLGIGALALIRRRRSK